MEDPDMSTHPTDETPALVEQLAQALLQRGWSLATAESCTGGLISAASPPMDCACSTRKAKPSM